MSKPASAGRGRHGLFGRDHDIATVHPAQQRFGRLAGHDLAAVDDRDLIAELLGFFQIVGGQDDRYTQLVQTGDVLPELAAQLDVDAGGGLIQDQNRRLMDHGLGHHQTPLHAAGQLADIGVGLIAQAERVEQLVCAALALGHAIEAGLDLQRLSRREEDVGGQLLRHHADRRAGVAWALVDVTAPDPHRARAFADQTGQNVDEG